MKWHGFTDWLAPLNLLEICYHRATKAALDRFGNARVSKSVLVGKKS